MAHIGKKVTPRPFQLMHLRDISRHHQQLFVGIRHDANLQMPPGVEHQIERAREITRFQILRKLRVTQQVKDVLPVIFRPAQAKNLLRQTVAPENTALFRGQHHRVGQRLRAATKAFNQIAQFTAAFFISQLHLV